MAAAVRPVAGHRHHAIGHMSQLAPLLRGRQHDAVAPLRITGLVHDEHPAGMRTQIRVRLPAFEPAAIEGRGIPRRVVPRMVQRLPVGAGHDRRHLHDRLVVLAGQQQADEIVAERDALLRATEEGIELGTERIDRRGRGRRGLAGVGRAGPPAGRWPARNDSSHTRLPHVLCHC
jgi:hypothetical protein